jgi:hypothetical protein
MEKVATFLERVWQNKLWIVAMSILVASATFLVSFIPRVPAEWERFSRRSVELDEDTQEGSRAAQVYDQMGGITKAYIEATERYSKDFGGKNRSAKISSDRLAEGFVLMDGGLNTARSSLGAIQGIRFRDKDLERDRGVIEENARAVCSYLEALSRFYLAQAENDGDSLARATEAVRGVANDQARTGAALHQAMSSFSASTIALSKKQTLAAARSVAELRMFYVKGDLALAAGLYVLVFAVVVAWRIFRPKEGRRILLP